MKVAKMLAAVRSWRREAPGPVVLVPTMGALHHGHAALIRKARSLAGSSGSVAVTIFVNPAQFGPGEDFKSYPRPVSADLKICEENKADLVFLPPVDQVYADDRSAYVDEASLSQGLCGRTRPGHFRGVCTVVAKLFNIVQPDMAVFGEKDWQQLAIIRRMVRDLDFPVRIVGHPTVREEDGLATSSRNAYLDPAQREAAPALHAALVCAAALHSPAKILNSAERLISRIPGAKLDYVELVHAETLAPLESRRHPGRLAAAVYFGRARLIDNIPVPELP